MKIPFLISLLMLSSASYAHDLWIAAPDTLAKSSELHADLAYGEHFPKYEKIESDRVKLLNPLQLYGENGQTTTLRLVKDNHRYTSQNKLKSGSYYILASYRPTFWLKTAQGKWLQGQNLRDVSDATYCEQSQMFAKRFLVAGNDYDEITATVPVGQMLEIVPLSHPQTVKAGGILPIQVWYQGKPLAGATVMATSDTYLAKDPESSKAHRQIQAYSGKTDADGKVNFIPLIEGEWQLHVSHKADFENRDVCQFHSVKASLMIPVGKMRAQVSAESSDEHHHDHDHHHHHH